MDFKKSLKTAYKLFTTQYNNKLRTVQFTDINNNLSDHFQKVLDQLEGNYIK